ncbi:hypothetical protein J2Y38_004970 [Flavobacterium sp. 2755]|uniref:site-specific integrase n=1 Tax=Flavobacterium sp. 2755 TaxID=2817765 RepID=UPI00285A2099|nr:site-specific integrase [Flavobacterium sp. 2755]MDR6764733.1 hypothetical protein [Flavobacterium sp. 2755]
MKKTNVTLRRKVLADGRISLYLDFYPPILNPETNKLTRREFLKLYLFEKPKTRIQKISNIENLHTAELIQIRRQNELRKYDIYSAFEKEQLELKKIGEASFMKYINNLADQKAGKNFAIWISAIAHFKDFLKEQDISFKDINVTLINDYREYLLKAKSRRDTGNVLARNTALSYYNKLKTTLKRAYKEGKLRNDINAGIDSIKEAETQRNFLTLNEAKILFNTPCSSQIVYKISMFSTLTGLRYSDISKLIWSEIEFIEHDGYYIVKLSDIDHCFPI